MTDTVSTTTRVKIDANRPTATQVVDGDSYTAELDLTPVARAILHDLGRALHRGNATWRLKAIGNPTLSDLERAGHVKALMPLVREALTLSLGPDQAEALSGELWSASEEPSRCEGYCDGENYAMVGPLCGDCAEAASFRNAMAGGVL
jgi:hypothetical protein